MQVPVVGGGAWCVLLFCPEKGSFAFFFALRRAVLFALVGASLYFPFRSASVRFPRQAGLLGTCFYARLCQWLIRGSSMFPLCQVGGRIYLSGPYASWSDLSCSVSVLCYLIEGWTGGVSRLCVVCEDCMRRPLGWLEGRGYKLHVPASRANHLGHNPVPLICAM